MLREPSQPNQKSCFRHPRMYEAVPEREAQRPRLTSYRKGVFPVIRPAVGSPGVVRVTYGASRGCMQCYTIALMSLFRGGLRRSFAMRVVTRSVSRASVSVLAALNGGCGGAVHCCAPSARTLRKFAVQTARGHLSVTTCCEYFLSTLLPGSVSQMLCLSYSVIMLKSVAPL